MKKLILFFILGTLIATVSIAQKTGSRTTLKNPTTKPLNEQSEIRFGSIRVLNVYRFTGGLRLDITFSLKNIGSQTIERIEGIKLKANLERHPRLDYYVPISSEPFTLSEPLLPNSTITKTVDFFVPYAHLATIQGQTRQASLEFERVITRNGFPIASANLISDYFTITIPTSISPQ